MGVIFFLLLRKGKLALFFAEYLDIYIMNSAANKVMLGGWLDSFVELRWLSDLENDDYPLQIKTSFPGVQIKHIILGTA